MAWLLSARLGPVLTRAPSLILAALAFLAAIVAIALHVMAVVRHSDQAPVLAAASVLVAFGVFAIFVHQLSQRSLGFGELTLWPVWARIGVAALFIYAGFNFVALVPRVADTAPESLSRSAFIRLLTGHLLPFLVVPGLYFTFVGFENGKRPPKNKRRTE